MRTLFTILLLIISTTLASHAQRFDSTALLTNLKTFSSDSFEGRRPGEEGGERSREFVKNQFIELGLTSPVEGYFQEFPLTKRDGTSLTGFNVMAQVEGTSDEYIVISAHHDHLGVRDGKIYNGADDDGSGTCALFAIGEYFSRNKPTYSLLLVAFDAEEWGLRGAKAFINDPPIPLKKIKLNINMDMIGRNVNNEIYVCGTRYNPELKELVVAIESPLEVSFGHDGLDGKQDWTNSSDHGPFHAAKIPFLYFGEEDHPDYHKPTDTFEGIMPTFYIQVVNLIIDTVNAFDDTH